ncbi:MAG: hypothetical protein PVG89_15475 [Gammaproteobacteria bacterium]
MINTLAVLTRHRAMEMETAKADCARADKILQDAESTLQQARSDVEGIENNVRETCNSQGGFSVQELMMQRGYLSEKRHDLSNARNGYDMAMKTREETSNLLLNKKRQMELVERRKHDKLKEYRSETEKQISASNDELCVQNRRTPS